MWPWSLEQMMFLLSWSHFPSSVTMQSAENFFLISMWIISARNTLNFLSVQTRVSWSADVDVAGSRWRRIGEDPPAKGSPAHQDTEHFRTDWGPSVEVAADAHFKGSPSPPPSPSPLAAIAEHLKINALDLQNACTKQNKMAPINLDNGNGDGAGDAGERVGNNCLPLASGTTMG